jgi:hypothetical protein
MLNAKKTNEIKDIIAQMEAKVVSLNELLFCKSSWEN